MRLNFLCDGARNRTRVRRLGLGQEFPRSARWYLVLSTCFDVGQQVIQRAGIDPTYTVQMVAAIHISLEEAQQNAICFCTFLHVRARLRAGACACESVVSASLTGDKPICRLFCATDHDGSHQAQEARMDGKGLRGNLDARAHS